MAASDAVATFLAQNQLKWDTHHLARVRPETLHEYRRQIQKFVSWYRGRKNYWMYFWQLDMLIVTFKMMHRP